jgi:hypothetical protein
MEHINQNNDRLQDNQNSNIILGVRVINELRYWTEAFYCDEKRNKLYILFVN